MSETWHVLRSRVVWVAGRYQGDSWELQGVYSNQKLAEQHAKAGWFIGPVKFNEPLPEETTDWPGVFVVEQDGIAV